jgi:PadR family transcriptional regulator, regulatory protein PadR
MSRSGKLTSPTHGRMTAYLEVERRDADFAGGLVNTAAFAEGVQVLLLSHRCCAILIWESNRTTMAEKAEVWQGTLALMVLKCLEALGSQHGYGIARRIEQTSENVLSINHGTLYPVLLKLEQEGSIASEWGLSDNNRKAKFYRITKTGRKQLETETRHWQQTTDIIARFFALRGEAR